MRHAPLKTPANFGKTRVLVIPFVRDNIPLIVIRGPSNIPFVRKNRPNKEFKQASLQIHGFTLIELIVTLAVVTILISIAVPNLTSMIQNNRITTRVNNLISDLNYARSEAIKSRSNITVCQSSDGATCTGGDWKDGRLVMGATVLRIREADGGSDGTLTLVAAADPVFVASGATTAVGSTVFTFCDGRGVSYGKAATLNSTGQVTVTPATTC